MTGGLLVLLGSMVVAQARADDMPPDPAAMAAAREDVWAEAALRHPGGPSHEFFRDLLPPLRYVNTAFRVYPVVLSAPRGAVKARWVADGSAVNARAHQPPMWREIGTPVHFLIGEPGVSFGSDPAALDGPRYADGFLPIVEIVCKRGKVTYRQDAFVPASGAFADHGAVWVRFSTDGGPGVVRAQLDPDLVVVVKDGKVCDVHDRTILFFDARWTWDEARHELRARLAPGEPAVLVVATRPMPLETPRPDVQAWDTLRDATALAWNELLHQGASFDIPEKLVQDAWRSLVLGQFLIAAGDRMNYSAGNAYDHLYEAECGDAARSLMLFGHLDAARAMLGPLLDFQRQATRVHVAGHKLQLLAHYHGLTRDAATVRALEAKWKPALDFIVEGRDPATGLMPPDNYAGDIAGPVPTLSSNANAWRGLRDMALVLDEMGEHERAKVLMRHAADFRAAILAAVARNEQQLADGLFIPNALDGTERAYDVTTATRRGSYYDLMAPYVLGSGVFGPGDRRESALMRYLRTHGGLAMGMIRSTPHEGPFAGEPGANVLYGLRYVLTLLRRDEVELAQAAFYAQLAHGMTPGTFIGGEGSRFLHGDRHGRSFYLPPNSASNATFLTIMRYLLIQDWDVDGDGRPETLQLLYGAPGRWFEDGKTVSVERAPTQFGPISIVARSDLSRRDVTIVIDPPPRRPWGLLVRVPLPEGWKVTGAALEDGTPLPPVAPGVVAVPQREGRATIRVRVDRR